MLLGHQLHLRVQLPKSLARRVELGPHVQSTRRRQRVHLLTKRRGEVRDLPGELCEAGNMCAMARPPWASMPRPIHVIDGEYVR